MRKYFIAAMAVAALAAFAVPGTAFAVSANVSTLDAKFNPTNPGATRHKGGLLVETTTLHASGGSGTPTLPAKEPVPTTQVDLDFDHAITFSTNAVARCTGSLTGTTQSGMANCVDSLIGGGYATLCAASGGPGTACDLGGSPSSVPPAPGVLNAQVTAYNGPKNGGTRGTSPTVLLQSVADHTPLGPTTVVLTGSLVRSPLGGEFAKRLTVPVPTIGGGAAAITDFTVGVNNGNFVRGKCDNGTWNFRATFSYLAGGPDVDNHNQSCT